ncbi:hypothetical protein SBDP1_530019 [Syntrophobacter sp. SbD1]|nr:hypothetical protein SBDP1_530019 [Syntrophobacter sp. SbD1]
MFQVTSGRSLSKDDIIGSISAGFEFKLLVYQKPLALLGRLQACGSLRGI